MAGYTIEVELNQWALMGASEGKYEQSLCSCVVAMIIEKFRGGLFCSCIRTWLRVTNPGVGVVAPGNRNKV